MGLYRHEFPAAEMLPQAARLIISLHRDIFPDLSSLTILAPNLHAAQAIARALGEAADSPLLLPRITTLFLLADSKKPPAAGREIQLYDALRGRKWFAESDLWPIANELSFLFDELTKYRVRLPENAAAFQQVVETAFQMRGNEALLFEARLVHELWMAMEAGEVSRFMDYYLRLAAIAREAKGSLYVFGLERLTVAEEEFLQQWSEKGDAHLFMEDFTVAPEVNFLAQAWSEDISSGFIERARHWRKMASPLAHFSLFAANSLEEEAEGAEVKIRQWLLAGKTKIAVVVADRLVARRVRARLERARVLVMDETGWTFSTTSAATAVMRWLETVASRFYHQDLLDLAKSPFIFADWPEAKKRQAIHQLEMLIRKNNVVSNIEHYLKQAVDEAAIEALRRLQTASLYFRGKSRSAGLWLSALEKSLDELGLTSGLQGDAAGVQLLQNLRALRRNLQSDSTSLSFGEWRRWLDIQLENLTFRDEAIQSPVVFTILSATRLRDFDAVMLLGCDAAHFPGSGKKEMFFNQAVRRDLGLPAREEETAHLTRELLSLLSRPGSVWISWQASKNGDANLLSPFFERLQTFHLCAFGSDLLDRDFAAILPFMRIKAAQSAPVGRQGAPAVAVASGLIAPDISASGYNSLLACPYQYYARHMLRLNPLDEVEEKIDRADFGIYAHKILQQFHTLHPQIAHLPKAREILQQISNDVFASALEADYLSHAWAIRWNACIDPYLAWQKEREAQGWKIAQLESPGRLDIALENGRTLRLRGRIDRIDQKSDEYAVVDYKTQTAASLRAKLKEPWEDMQLPVYLLLLQENGASASFLSLGKEKSEQIEADIVACDWMQGSLDRLAEIFADIYSGAPLRAQGVEAVCNYCDMRGLCRKDYWS